MFSGFDQFTEGFKRFSLDALQQQEEEEGSTGHDVPNTKVGASALAPVPEQPSEAPPATQPAADKDSKLGNPVQEVDIDSQVRKGSPRHENEANHEPSPMSGQRSSSDVAVAWDNNSLRAESPPLALAPMQGEMCASAYGEGRTHGEEEVGQEAAARVVEGVVHHGGEAPESKQGGAIASDGRLGARTSCGYSPAAAAAGEVQETVSSSDKTAFQPSNNGDEGRVTTNQVLPLDSEAGNTTSARIALPPGGRSQRPERRDSSPREDGVSASHPGELFVSETSYANGVDAAETTSASNRSASPEPQLSDRQEEGTGSGIGRPDVPARGAFAGSVTGENARRGETVNTHETEAGAKALAEREEELARAKRAASELGNALEETRSEAQQLREMLEAEKDTTRQQAAKLASLSDEVSSAKMGFQESNAAHQRTAERSHAVEQELYKTRKTVDDLRTEAAVLREQASVAKEDRQALEAQLRQLQVGLTEGQEAARREGKKEVERLEARVKDLLKDRERKHAELELQNARRKETREMARDLESQLASVDRTANEREAELNVLKGEIASLKKNTGEVKDEKNTWATKYDALERNFKQVRAQNRRAESESEDLRQRVARVEAEKRDLEERVEVEGAERVTVVASITHERDFLLRQVNRLELSLSDLQRSQEAQAATAATRAQTTGMLEEYRTRAQQALKRANEMTSQTAAENKRLEAETAKLSAEVAQQRPIWEKSKQLEDVHRAEVAELKGKLSSEATTREGLETKIASLQERLAEEEEGRRNTHVSVNRLEAQGKSLKQELQRQQRALAAAEERESTLQKRLADKEAVKHVDEGQLGKHMYEGADGVSDMVHIPQSPLASALPTQMGWEEERLTPRSGTGEDAGRPGVAHTRHSMGGSFNSIPSEGDSVDAQPGNVGEQLFYVHQLRARMSKEQIEMRSLISELEASRTAAEAQSTKQAQLESQLEAALLDKKRLQDLDSGRNAAINLEYLKNCVVGCLRTSEPSEHARLLPVITTILKLSREEADVIAKNISSRAQHQGSFGGSLPPPAAGASASGAGGAGGARSWWGALPPQKKK